MDSCGLPFSISNLAETGLPFFLLAAKPCSSVTLAPVTTGASSAFSLSVVTALVGNAHKATAKTDKNRTGLFDMATSLDICCSEFGSRVESRHSRRQRRYVRSKALSGFVFTPTTKQTESLFGFGASVRADVQP